MDAILLSVCSSDRREELIDMLGDAREIICADSPETADVEAGGVDLWILDRQRLHELGIEALQDYKDREPTVASPILLLAPDSRPSQLDPALWSHVDDIVGTPLRQAELNGRIRALLRMRQYSADAEEARKEKERGREQLAAAERVASFGSWERDLKEEKLYWSEETYRIFGLSSEEPVTYEQFMEVVHPEDRDTLRRQQKRLLEEGMPIDIEYRICRPDGGVRIVREQGEVDRREDGTPVRLFGAVHDVTEQRRREQKIEGLRKKYEGLLQGAPDAIFVVEKANAKIVEANREAGNLLDTSVGSIVGRRVTEIHPPDDRDRYRALFEESVSRGGRETFSRFEDGSPLFVVTDSGERIPVEFSATPVSIGDREYVMGIVRDVRRRHRAQRRRRIFEQAVEHSGDAIFITDPEGEIQYVNPATEEITGYEAEELVGATPQLWQSGETPDEVYERFWNAIQRGETYRDTFTNETKDGALIDLDEIVVPLEDPLGEIQYYVAMGRDVTEQKEAQRKLREREERLRGLANSIPGVVYQFYARPDGTYGARFVSEHAEEVLGISADPEDFYERFVGQVPDSHREALTRSVDRAVAEGAPWRFEFPFEKPSGERIWVLGTSTPETREEELVYNGVILDITERKRQEEALKERQEKVDALYETTRRLLEARSPSGVADRVHEQLEEIFDYAAISISLVEGKDIVPVKTTTRTVDVPSPTRESLTGNSISAKTLRAGETVVFENVHALENEIEYGEMQSAVGVPIGERGTIIVGQAGTEAFRPFDLQLIEVLGTYASIVLDRLDREQTLRDTRDRMELTLKQTGSVVFESNFGTPEITRHGSFEDPLDVSIEELQTWDAFVEQVVHPKDRETFRALYRDLEAGRRESGRVEYRTRSDMGDVRWLRETVFVEEEGGSRRLRGIAQDITREKEREQALREVSERLRATIEAAPVPLLALDLDGNVQLWNSAAERIFGWTEDEVLGEPLPIVPEEKQSEFAVLRHRVEEGERIEGREIRRRLKGGDWVDLRLFAAPMHDDQGDVFGLMAALEDITEEKQREQQLRAAKRQAEEANRMQSAFLANMSHEIRTPLTSIIGFAEALGTESSELDLPEGSALPEYANLIEQGGKRLLETLEGVLNLSKLEAGQMELGEGPVDLAAEVQRTVEELRSKARKKGIDLQVQTERVQAGADEGGVQIIARNLLSNAIKYTDEGGTVWLRTYQEEGKAVLAVEDTGIGMEPETVESLFEPFRQASEGFGREYEGTGVGLAVTREATEQMDGHLEVETEKDAGSRFVVRLPLVENLDASENQKAGTRKRREAWSA